jgi:hypothetical protein
MALSRDDLRTDLLAVLEAAPELSRDNREHLADVFLDRLDEQFRLVPRPRDRAWSDGLMTAWSTFLQAARGWLPLLAAGFGLLLLLPLLVLPFFVLFHAPFLIFVLVFLFFRFGGMGMRRRRTYWW